MRRKISGTGFEVAAYAVLVTALAIGALILSDIVLGVGAAVAAIALFGALHSRARERRGDDQADH